MILRLQSVEELELLQNRIKAKAKGIKDHVSPLRNDTGTELNAAPHPNDSAKSSEPNRAEVLAVAAQDASRKPQKRAKATFEHQLLGRQLTQAQIAFREEFRFEPKRRWRFDFLVGKDLAVEIDGGLWIRGRHSGGQGQIDDMEKGNHAILLGYRILRFTPDQVKSGEAIGFIETCISRSNTVA